MSTVTSIYPHAYISRENKTRKMALVNAARGFAQQASFRRDIQSVDYAVGFRRGEGYYAEVIDGTKVDRPIGMHTCISDDPAEIEAIIQADAFRDSTGERLTDRITYTDRRVAPPLRVNNEDIVRLMEDEFNGALAGLCWTTEDGDQVSYFARADLASDPYTMRFDVYERREDPVTGDSQLARESVYAGCGEDMSPGDLVEDNGGVVQELVDEASHKFAIFDWQREEATEETSFLLSMG